MKQTSSSIKHDLFFSFSTRFILIIKGLVSQIIIARYLGVDGRGSFAVCIGFTMIMATLFTIGCDIAAIYFVSSRKFSISEGLSTAITIVAATTCACWILGFSTMQLPIEYFNKASTTAFYLALLEIPLLLLFRTFTQLLTALTDFKAFASFTLLNGILHLVLVFLFLGIFHKGVVSALLAGIIAEIFVVITALIYMRIKYKIEWLTPKWEQILQMLHYGIRHYFGRISNLANNQVGAVLVAFFCTKYEIGIFAVASVLAAQVMIVPDTFLFTLMPRTSASKEGRKELIARLTRVMTLFALFLCVVIICLAKFLITLLFGAEYGDSTLLLQILCTGYCLRSVAKLCEPYFFGIGRPGIPSISVFIGIIVNLIILATLLPRIGIPATALGTTISFVVSSIILFWSFHNSAKIGIREMLVINKTDIKYLKSLRLSSFKLWA